MTTMITIDEILGVIPTLNKGEREQLRQALANPVSTEPLRVTVRFRSYNKRRYSPPWLARVTSWPVGGRPEVEFGRCLGNDEGGECEVMACPGSIIRFGQRDNGGNDGTNDWGIVGTDGTVTDCTEAQARERFGK